MRWSAAAPAMLAVRVRKASKADGQKGRPEMTTCAYAYRESVRRKRSKHARQQAHAAMHRPEVLPLEAGLRLETLMLKHRRMARIRLRTK